MSEHLIYSLCFFSGFIIVLALMVFALGQGKKREAREFWDD